MNRHEQDSILKRKFTVLQAIWMAMLLSVTIYPIVGYMIVTRSNMGGFEATDILFMTLAAVSAGMLVAQFFVRKLLSDDKMFPRVLNKLQRENHGENVVDEDMISGLLQEHQSLGITVWALGEAPAIFGLMLTFLSGDFRYALGFAIFSLTTMNVFRPRYNAFVGQLKRFHKYLETRGHNI